MLNGGAAGSAGSLDEDCLLLQPGAATLRSTVYCRAPASLQTGQLQLQLVADTDGAGGGGGARSARAQQAQRFLFLGEHGGAGASLADQERWIVEQPVIVLPDSGGLVLPLASSGFLVGLLVVERCSAEEGEAAHAAGTAVDEQGAGQAAGGLAADAGTGGVGADDAGASAGGSEAGGARGAMPPPPACLLFRPSEVQLVKQTAAVLALACAMDLRAALERAGAAYRQRQASALVQEVSRDGAVPRIIAARAAVFVAGCHWLPPPPCLPPPLPLPCHLAGLPVNPCGAHACSLYLCCGCLPFAAGHRGPPLATPRVTPTLLVPAAPPPPQAKKPLSVMRTLGTMLLPRLQPGEPDRDFAQGGRALRTREGGRDY